MSVEDIFNKAKNIGTDLVGDVVDKATDTFTAVANKFDSGKELYQAIGKVRTPAKLDDSDTNYINKIKDESGWEKTKSFMGTAVQLLTPKPVEDLIDKVGDKTGLWDLDDTKYKSGVDRGLFRQNYDEKKATYSSLYEKYRNKETEILSNPKYSTLNAFTSAVEKHTSQGRTQEEAVLLAQQEFTAAQLKRIDKEQADFNVNESQILLQNQKELEDSYKDLERYTKESISVGDTGDVLNIGQKKFEGSLGVMQELMIKSGEEVDMLIGKDFLADKTSNKNLPEKIDKIKELFTDLEYKRLAALSETKPEDVARINGEYKDYNESMKKFYINQIKQELALDKKYKGILDQDGIEKQAAMIAFNSLSEDDQLNVKHKKFFDNMQMLSVNNKQMKEAFADGRVFNGIYNYAESLMDASGLALNLGLTARRDDITSLRVGNPVINADNIIGSGFVHAMYYNPGDVANTMLSLGVGPAVLKGYKLGSKIGTEFLKELPAIQKVSSILEGSIAGQRTQFILNSGAKIAKLPAQSVVTGTAPNAAIDFAMGEINTKAQEEFNMFTDVFFDAGILGVGKTGNFTKHTLLNDLMFGETKQARDEAVAGFTKYLNEKEITNNGKTFDNQSTQAFLRDRIIPLYNTTLKGEVADKIFNKGDIYGYATEQLKRLDDAGINTLLTGDGHIINSINPFNQVKAEVQDIFTLGEKLAAGSFTGKTKELYKNTFEQRLKTVEDWANGTGLLNGSKLKQAPDQLTTKLKTTIGNIKSANTNTYKELADNLIEQIHTLNDGYGSRKYREVIELTNALSGMTVKFSRIDLDKIAQAQGKTTTQLFQDGLIELTQKQIKDIGLTGKKSGAYVVRENGLKFIAKVNKEVIQSAEDWLKTTDIPGENIRYNTNRLSVEFRQLLTGLSEASEGKGIVKTPATAYIKGEIEFLQQELIKVFGQDLKTLELGNKTLPVSEIRKLAEQEDSFFVLAYGSLYDDITKNTKAKSFIPEELDISEGRNIIKYLLPGKKLMDSEIGNLFIGLKEDNFGHLTNKTIDVLRDILKNSKVKENKIDFAGGISALDAIESYSKYGEIIDVRGVVDTTKVKQIVQEALYLKDDTKEIVANVKDIQTLVIDIAALFDKEANPFMGTIIKNATHAFVRNLPLVKKLIVNAGKNEKMEFLKKILLNDNSIEALSKKMNLLPDDAMYQALVKREYDKIILNNRTMAHTLNETLLNLQASIKTYKGTKEITERIKKDIKKIESDITKVNKNLNISFEDFEKKNANFFFSQKIYDKLGAVMDNAILHEKGKLSKQITGYEDQLKKLDETIKLSEKISNEEKTIAAVKIDAIEKATDFQTKFDLLTQLEQDTTVSKAVRDYIKNSVALNSSKFKDMIWIDEQKLIADLTTKANIGTGIYSKIQTLKNNPIGKLLKETLSKKSILEGNDNDYILKALNEKYGANSKNINELYNLGGDFKKFIDNLQYTSETKEGLDGIEYSVVGDKNKTAFVEEIKTLLTNAYKDVDFKALDGLTIVDIKDELIHAISTSNEVYDSFKRLADKVFYKDVLVLDKKEVTKFDNKGREFNKKITQGTTGFYDTKVLRIEEMRKNIPGVGFIKISGIDAISSIELGDKKTIASFINDVVDRGAMLDKNGVPVLFLNDVEIADLIFKYIDGGETPFTIQPFTQEVSWIQKEGKNKGERITKTKEIKTFDDLFSDFFDPKVKYKQEIRSQLGLTRNETIVGTFGDKDAYLQKYDFGDTTMSFDKKQDVYQEIYANTLGYKGLGPDVIAKRETFNVSNYNTFDNVKIPIRTFILKEVNNFSDTIKTLVQSKGDIEKIKAMLSGEVPKDIYDDIMSGLPTDTNDIYSYLENIITKDFNDGTSWSTKSIWQLRNKIQGLDKDDTRSFKDHFYGLNKDGLIYGGKTLFNKANSGFKLEDEYIKDAVAIGEGSMKLKKQARWYGKEKTIIINGREYKAIGEIDGTTTQDFKNAASDAFEDKEEQSVALQIINGLPVEHQQAIGELIKGDIDTTFKKTILERLGTSDRFNEVFKNKSQQEVEDIISNYIAAKSDLGTYTDSLLGTYVDDFLGSLESIITKGPTLGEQTFMQEVDPLLKSNEVILSKENNIVKHIITDMKERIQELPQDNAERLKLEQKLQNEEYEIVGYRYPVASKYNLGVYRIKLAENLPESSDISKYKNIDSHNVIMSPYAVFIKKEGDFDGDHLYMLSAHSKKGKILSRAALEKPMTISDTELLDVYDNIRNKHITTSQVESEKPTYNLYTARMVALTAKRSVGLVSAGIRTMRLLRNLNTNSDEIIYKGYKPEDNIRASDFKKYNFKSDDGTFDEGAASILQIALDFAKSGKSEFDRDWVKKLYNLVIDDVNETMFNDFYKKFKSLSMGYGGADKIEKKDIASLAKGEEATLMKYKSAKLGIKGDMYSYAIQKYLPKVQEINITNDLPFMMKIMNKGDQNLAKIIAKTSEILDGELYLNKPKQKELKKFFQEEFKGYKNEDLNKLVSEYNLLKGSGMKPYEAASLVNKSLLEDNTTRHMFAMYTFSDGNSKLFDLLLAKEKLEFIKDSDGINRKRLSGFIQGIPEQPKIANVEEINLEIEKLKSVLSDTSGMFDSQIDELNTKITDLQEELKQLEEQESKQVESFTEKITEADSLQSFVEVQGEFIPRVDFSVENTRESLEDTFNQFSVIETVRKGFGKFVLSDVLNKSDPLLLERIDMVSSEVNTIGGLELGKKYKEKFLALSKMLKKDFGLRKVQAEKYMKSIDEVFTGAIGKNQNGYYIKKDIDTILDEISSKNVNTVTGFPLFDAKLNESFKKLITEYKEVIIDNTLKTVDHLETITKDSMNEINITKAYLDKPSDTLFKDIIEASKSDYSFALRTKGINNQTEAIDYLISTGMSDRNASIIANTFYPPRGGSVEKIFNTFNALHYMLGYGLISTLTHQKGQIMGMIQLLPNFMQIMSKIALHKDELSEAELIIQRYKFLGNEDIVRLSLGYDSEISQTGFMNTLSRLTTIPFDKLGKMTGKDFTREGKYVESFLLSPLTFWDAPLDGIRKRAALIEFAHTLGIETKDIPKFIDARVAEGWAEQDIKNFVNSGMRRFYANSGGGVVSSSQLHRKTLLNTMNIYGEDQKNIIPRVFMSAVGYLNGWAFHNTAQYLDNQLGFLRAGMHLRDGNLKAFKDEMSNWMSYNSSLLYMSNNALGLYMKTEKYERDAEDLPRADQFMRSFNNILVARDILLGQVMQSSEIANRYGDTSNVLGFTSYKLIERFSRTIAVIPKLLTGVIDAYKYADETENVVESTFAAAKAVSDTINSMNDSYMRYIGYQAMTDSYDTITDKSNLALLGLGANTSDDDIFEFVMKGKEFARYQDTGFLVSVSNMFKYWFDADGGKFSVTAKEVKNIMNEAYKRDGLKNLLNNEGISNIDGIGYNLGTLLGKDPDNLTQDQQSAIKALYNDVAYDYSKELDSKGRNQYKIGDFGDDENAQLKGKMLDDIVVTELKRKMELQGLNFEEIINAPSAYPQGFLKLKALAEFGGDISAGQIIAYTLYRQQSNAFKELTKSLGQYDEMGKPWTTDYQDSYLKRKVLMDNAAFLNTDATIVNKVIELELKHNNPDLYTPLQNTYRDQKITKEANRMLANEYLATRNLQRGDTSVGVNTTRWSTLFKDFSGDNETAGKVIIKTLIDIENSAQDPKTKLAKKASAVLGMDKAMYGLLKDDKKFETLSYNTKKVIANWIYDTSIKSVDYDANSILKDIVGSAQGGYSKKYYPNKVLSDYKKKNFNDARPNFSKQFQPLKEFLPKMSKYLSQNPGDFVGQAMRGYSQGSPVNYLKTPIMKEYYKVKLDMYMPELLGTNIIKAGGTKPELAKQRKKTIILKPKRKVKNLKRTLVPVRIPKASKGLLSDKPFNYD